MQQISTNHDWLTNGADVLYLLRIHLEECFIISAITTRESSADNKGTVGIYLDSVDDLEPREPK